MNSTKITYDRQVGIFDPKDMVETVSIIGCGSVGSFTALALSKMGAKIKYLYDSDIIEEHNLSNQFFKLNDLEKKKNEALEELLKEFSNVNDIELFDNVNNRTMFKSQIVISAVDSMSARKLIWERVKKSSEPKLYIDSRMGGKVYSIFTVDLRDALRRGKYEESLVDDSNVEPIRCTERTIIFNVLGVASSICNQLVKWFREEYHNDKSYSNEIHFSYEDYMTVSMK